MFLKISLAKLSYISSYFLCFTESISNFWNLGFDIIVKTGLPKGF